MQPVPQDDWRRRGQEKFLKGAALGLQAHQPPRADWDHDHCEFCMAKFSLFAGDLVQGYTTLDRYRWICEECFADFRDEFGWIVRDPVLD